MFAHQRPTALAVLLLISGGLSSLPAESTYDGSPEAVAQRIDAELAREMQVKTGGPLAADATLLRRVSLDLVGRIPTPESLARFALDTDPAKRGKLVDRLLDDPAYGENWARYWRDAILYRRTDEKALISNQSLTNYLQEAFNENFAWNDIASAFITADGDVRENGATGLIMAQMGQPEETVGEVSRLFMGIQIQCAQCHDHPTDQWTREQFHELAAFFPRVAVRPNRNMTDKQNRSFIVFANDWRQPRRRKPNNNRRFPDLEHSMPDLEDPLAAGTRMRPVFFLNAASLDYGTPDAERRETLAQWITDETNPWFSTAIVNRIWSELVGRGFYEPVDDLGPDRDAVAPQTLEILRSAFVSSGHDLKWLLRTIMATQIYQRDSQTRAPTGKPTFAHFTPQRLRADQLFDALSVALNVDPSSQQKFSGRATGKGGTGKGGTGKRGNGKGGNGRGMRGPRAAFNKNFGYDPSDPRGEITDSIPQALSLMNSPIINNLISVRRRPELRELLFQHPQNGDLVYELYLRFLSREPTTAEENQAVRYIQKIGNRAEACEDLIWVLISSTEFRHKS